MHKMCTTDLKRSVAHGQCKTHLNELARGGKGSGGKRAGAAKEPHQRRCPAAAMDQAAMELVATDQEAMVKAVQYDLLKVQRLC